MRKQRMFDPVLQRSRDGADTASTAAPDRVAIARANRARDQQLRYQASWDIINHRPLVPEPIVKPTRLRGNQSLETRAGYNIVSNEAKGHAGSASAATAPASQHSQLRGQRDFDLVSNRYHADHERKIEREQQAAKAEATARFWRNRDYNPVLAKHYDDGRDAEHTKHDDAYSAARQTRSLAAQPQVMRASEGAAFNIVSGEVHADEIAAAALERAQRPGKRQQRAQTESRMKQAGLQQTAQRESRAHATRAYSTQRLAEYARGYDIVSSTPLQSGMGGHAPVGNAALVIPTSAALGTGGGVQDGVDPLTRTGNLARTGLTRATISEQMSGKAAVPTLRAHRLSGRIRTSGLHR